MKINKKYIALEHLFTNYKKTVHLFMDRRLRSCTCFERNNAGLKKLSEQTSDSSAPRYVLSCEQQVSYFDPD
jgi:hypothetical protein